MINSVFVALIQSLDACFGQADKHQRNNKNKKGKAIGGFQVLQRKFKNI